MKIFKVLLSLFLTTVCTTAEPAITAIDQDKDGWPEWSVGSEAISFPTPGQAMQAAKQDSIPWFIDRAGVGTKQDIAVLRARRFYDEGDWGNAFESLKSAGSRWYHYYTNILHTDPTTERLFQNGWKAQAGMTGLRRGNEVLQLDSAQGKPLRHLRLGDTKAYISSRGTLVLPHLNLAIRVKDRTEIDWLANDLAGTNGVTEQLGTSVKGQPIFGYRLGTGSQTVLFFGAFHGDEPESTMVVKKFLEYLRQNPDLLSERTAILVPVVNPDGLGAGERKNANGVDLNRNYPTSNWNSEGKGTNYWGGKSPASEPETKVVVELLDRYKPDRIISIHCPYKCVNYDGPAESLAEIMSEENGYAVEPSIGYPTPGSFGSYAGIEGRIPTITLELPPTGEEDVWKDNRGALVRALRGR